MNILTSNLTVFISIILMVCSCKGQSGIKEPENTIKGIELGKSVPELDKTIWFIYQDRQSNYWFSSKENGIYRYDGKGLTQFTQEDGLVSNQIREVQEDSDGNLFFETTSGVSKYDGESFRTLEIKENHDSSSLWVLEPDDLWFRIGFNKKGPYRYDGTFLHYLPFPKAPQEDEFNKKGVVGYSPYGIYSIYKDKKGYLWFGTTSLGICRFDGQNISWHYEEQLQTTPEGGDFGSRTIFEDKDGFFWFNNSRFRYQILPHDTNTIAFNKKAGIGYVNENNSITFPFFLSITQDDEGDLWMVTYDDGVWRYNGKELINYPVRDGNTDILLFTIYKDNKGVLWLGTFNGGAYRFDGRSFVKFEP